MIHFDKTRAFLSIRMVLLVVLLMMGALGWGFLIPATAQEPGEFVLAPVNPAFLDYHQKTKVGVLQSEQTGDGQVLGYIPSPLDLSHLKEQEEEQVLLQGRLPLGYPASYDLRTEGKLTPVKNQGSCGSCWAFATYGSMESNLLPSETQDFSENHLKNTHGFDWGDCDGGNAYLSAAYLARWGGPVSESDDPYNADSGSSPPGLEPQKHIQEILIVPDRSGPSNNDRIKQAVMSYGGVYTTYYVNNSYYNSPTYAYYYNGSASANHAVVIVGWDDDFSKSNFSITPPGNGAFIIRNSWGASWGEDGYFYISYYDSKIGNENFVFVEAESTTNYSRIYQYDPLGWVTGLGVSGTTGWFANIFTTVADEQLAAVSFYTAALNSAYTLYVYNNVTSGPTSGSVVGSKTGTIASPGYHTIPIDSPVLLTSGQDFSVVVRLTTPNYNFPIPIEAPYSNYSSDATSNYGESYISSDGTGWTDITSVYMAGYGYLLNTNVCLKAFTVSASETVSTPTTLSGPASGDTGTTYTFMAGGSASSFGHSVQYFFDWGDGTDSGWLSVGTMSASHSWSSANTHAVRVKARCGTNTSVESGWTQSLDVTVAETSYSAMTVLAPNGGDSVPSGSTYRIQWGAPSGAIRFKVYYSTNNGATWKLIASAVTETSCDWTVPTVPKNQTKCSVKVVGYSDTAMKVKVGEDRSDSSFSIDVVKVTVPIVSQTFAPGDDPSVTWATHGTKSAVASVKISYTTGSTYKVIATLNQNLGTCSWTVPSVTEAKTKCKIKVVFYSAANGKGAVVATGFSDYFTIQPIP